MASVLAEVRLAVADSFSGENRKKDARSMETASATPRRLNRMSRRFFYVLVISLMLYPHLETCRRIVWICPFLEIINRDVTGIS